MYYAYVCVCIYIYIYISFCWLGLGWGGGLAVAVAVAVEVVDVGRAVRQHDEVRLLGAGGQEVRILPQEVGEVHLEGVHVPELLTPVEPEAHIDRGEHLARRVQHEELGLGDSGYCCRIKYSIIIIVQYMILCNVLPLHNMSYPAYDSGMFRKSTPPPLRDKRRVVVASRDCTRNLRRIQSENMFTCDSTLAW